MNVNKTDNWWPLYQNTFFKSDNDLDFNQQFSIITGFNPCGQILTLSENNLLDQLLVAKLRQLGLRYQPLLAGDQKFNHSEASYIVDCSLIKAVEIATEFKQNAIFWVEQDRLSLVPCLLDNVEQTEIGSFRGRLI